jgi:hypothetical protein
VFRRESGGPPLQLRAGISKQVAHVITWEQGRHGGSLCFR